MANACVDSNDFQTDSGGRLQLRPTRVTSVTSTFAHNLNGVNGTYEKITELPDLTITRAGLYVVTWDAHGNIVNPSPTVGSIINASVSAGLGINNVFQGNSETMLTSLNQGASTVDQPALGSEGSGSGTRIYQLNAGDTISLYGMWRRSASSVGTILSNTDGRCRITAWRISG